MSPLCIDSQRQSTVECNEQVQTLRLTDLADDDAGGAHAQRLLNQATQGNLTGALEAWLTALRRGHVAQRDLQFVDLDNWWSGLLQRLEFPHAGGSDMPWNSVSAASTEPFLSISMALQQFVKVP